MGETLGATVAPLRRFVPSGTRILGSSNPKPNLELEFLG